ncbi:MAG: ABC transporter family substrate-binding protein, partial [Mycobacterium sp.]
TRGRISKGGEQLSLVIGVAANDPTSLAVANTAADQLRNVGIAATVLALDPVKLYREALVTQQVDAIVGWQQAGGDLATLLASRYGCGALAPTALPTSGSPVSTPSTTPSPQSPAPAPAKPTPKVPPRSAAPGALVQAPSNITGVCDHAIQAEIDAAIEGSKSIGDVIASVEPRLWNMATVLPILQDTTIVAVGPSVANVSLTGAVPVGIVGGAGTWLKLP